MLFDSLATDAVPAHQIDSEEWDMASRALPAIPDFNAKAVEDAQFCVVMGSDPEANSVTVDAVYLREDDGITCWIWEPAGMEWITAGTCPGECTSVDEPTAREAAARLSAEAAKNSEAQNTGRFKGLPESDPRMNLGKPGGPLRKPSMHVKPGFEFDSSFGRAAWVSGTSGDGTMSPARTSTSFSIQELAEEYTPQERSQNASKQLRDSMGRFTKAGSVVNVRGSNRLAQVIDVDEANGTFKVRYGDGTVQVKQSGDVQRLKDSDPAAQALKKQRRILTRDDIVREARSTDLTQKASLPYALPILTEDDLQLMFSDYDAYIKKVRAQEAALKKYAVMTPETTDVKPLYIAQVDELDKQAVVDLFAIHPASKTSTQVILYRRAEGGWVRDDATLSKLKSTAPPPVVTLDAATFKQVLTQVDSYFKEKAAEAPAEASQASILAALRSRVDASLWDGEGRLIPAFEAQALVAAGVPGVADTPSDVAAARKLKNYWLRGRGAAKIRWNTPGDWTRCVKHLSKYMGVRARGYCQNLHKEATGMYTGDKTHRAMYGKKNLSTPTVVLASADAVSDDTQFHALVQVSIPTVSELKNLGYRDAGHQLRVGERFLVNGGDGLYALSVLNPADTIGWESTPAILVSEIRNAPVQLLQGA
jgi:hypothetical protein